VVDDLEDMRELYACILENVGYPVERASHGREALEKVGQIKPALVLVDLLMPVLDGWSMTSLIKSDPETAHVRVVAVTSNPSEDGLRQAIAAGADALVTRPCPAGDLLARVAALLGPRRAPAIDRRYVVVIVDPDDDDSRQLSTIVLLRSGFEVIATRTAADAVAALRFQRADALIIHETYAAGAAIALQNMAAAQLPGVRVVVTGHDSRAARRRNRQAGFHVHAAIPCTPYELEPVLHGWLVLAEEGRVPEDAFSVVRGGHVEYRAGWPSGRRSH
jgi:CheY-like chemotaxis protein